MTTQALEEFRSKVLSTPALQEEIREAFVDDGIGIVGVGKKHGYSFSEEEALEWLRLESGELSDFELELFSVAGGAPANCNNPEKNV